MSSPHASDLLQGEIVQYHEGTQIVRLVTPYVDGLKHGIETEFHSDGVTVRVRCEYKQGLKDGVFESFHGYGRTFMRIEYRQDKKHGLEMCFMSDGDPKEAFLWDNDSLHGEMIVNDRFGVNTTHAIFERGRMKRDLRKSPFDNETKRQAWSKRYGLPLLDPELVSFMTKFSR
jgi:antitoxin component YwqK of YwqJK toxin-antitoxin module